MGAPYTNIGTLNQHQKYPGDFGSPRRNIGFNGKFATKITTMGKAQEMHQKNC